MHTKDKLAAELRKIGLFVMADKAMEGYYHDYLSPLDLPTMQLVSDLKAVGTPDATGLSRRVVAGEFDATKEESDEWAASEDGQDALGQLVTENKTIGRLALRVEGDLWNAYYALPDTMEGAIFLGSIALRLVEDQERKQIFMALMRDAVGDIIEEKTGQRPTWPEGPQPAPESERSGHD